MSSTSWKNQAPASVAAAISRDRERRGQRGIGVAVHGVRDCGCVS